MKITRWGATIGWTVLSLGCSSFHTNDTPDDGGGALDAGIDVAVVKGDAGKRDATQGGHDAATHPDATLNDADTDAAPSTDATVTIDSVCSSPWSEKLCQGHTVSSIGTIQFSDDPRIGFARSEAGVLGVCYASVAEDFLTRELYGITFSLSSMGAPMLTTSITLFNGVESDTTPVCALGSGAGKTFHVLVYDTDNDVLEYGEIIGGGTPAYETFGPASVEGYLTLGVVGLDATHVLAAVGNATTGNIQSYAVAPYDGGATFASPVTVESGIGISLVGSGQFSLRAGAQPSMLIDMEPSDAGDAGGSRADLAIYDGTAWKIVTVEGANLAAALGYSPSLAVTDGGLRGVYYERDPGTADAGTSQLHVASITGTQVTIAEPLPAAPDNDPVNPLVGAAAAIGPDGRLFIAYVASPSPGKVALYLARPESTVPGAPIVIDTIDDQLSAADPPSVNLLVEPSGRVDVVYMRMMANSVYFATRDP